jgi:hypothetical protein
MFNCNLFENIDFNCFWFSSKAKGNKSKNNKDCDLEKKIFDVSKEYNISILPIQNNVEIENLYPPTDHVELWNTFIVGCDKTYILANVNDDHIRIPHLDLLPNRKGLNLLPDELSNVFDKIWDKTLTNTKLQFYMTWNGKLYFINTYPFLNGKQKVIGATLFMRAFEKMPEAHFDNGNLVVDKSPTGTKTNRDSNQLNLSHPLYRIS